MLTHLHDSPIKPKRIVVLGANGFIPRALAASCNQNNIPFISISSRQIDLTASNATHDLAALLKPEDAVVMAAALTPDKGRDTATLMKNLRMAETLAAVLQERPVSQLIYLSSDAVYDWHCSLISETTAPSPTDLYSTMHVTRERMFAEVTTMTKTPYCVLRPCAVYGPDDTHNSYGPNRFAKTALQEGKIQLFGAGEEMRNHVFIGDVTKIITLAMLHRSTGVLNVTSAASHSFMEVAMAVTSVSPRPVAIQKSPRRNAITHRHFDRSALLRAFPEHRSTPLDAGLARLFLSP